MKMELEQALNALKPYQSEIPVEAFKVLCDNWSDAEPLLLAELDRRIEQPLKERDSALFFMRFFCAPKCLVIRFMNAIFAFCDCLTCYLTSYLGMNTSFHEFFPSKKKSLLSSRI